MSRGSTSKDCLDKKVNLGLDVFVQEEVFGNFSIFIGGEPSNDAQEHIDKLKALPENVRMMPNDTIEIIADEFECETTFVLK